MAKSRKDARGYVLHKGEYQMKDGRYSFSYTDRELIHIMFRKQSLPGRKRKNHY